MMFDVLMDFVLLHYFVNLTDARPYLIPSIEKVVLYSVYLQLFTLYFENSIFQ